MLSFLKDAGAALEIGGCQFAPLGSEPPTPEALAKAAQRYEQKRAQDRTRLESMLRFAQSHLCRNKLLFAYFGYAEDSAATCGTCDNCVRSQHNADARAEALALEEERRIRQSLIPVPLPAHITDTQSLSQERRMLLEQAISRRRVRFTRARALKVQRTAALAPRRSGFTTGDVVRHPLWGEGEVMTVVGDTIGAFFPGYGEKLLKAKFLAKA